MIILIYTARPPGTSGLEVDFVLPEFVQNEARVPRRPVGVGVTELFFVVGMCAFGFAQKPGKFVDGYFVHDISSGWSRFAVRRRKPSRALWYNFERMTGLTQNYRLVYEIVRDQARGTHLTPAEVFAFAKTKHKSIGFTTVYRALARMRELGLVSEISLPGTESAYYEPAGSVHAHFRCDACGGIEDIDYALAPKLVEELARKHRLDVQGVSINLRGTCRHCTDRAASSAG